MKQLGFVIIFLSLFLSACAAPMQTPAATLPDAGSNPCGDGVCSGPENAQNCPTDCSASTTPGRDGSTTPAITVPSAGGDAPLYMTTMTHMEQNFDDDKNQAIFAKHIQELTYGMDLADEYGVVLTIESEQPFARANSIWGNNFMAEIVRRGHGVGTHCDFGFHKELMPTEQYAQFFAENKMLVDALVGPENNLGCSGGGGVNDWATAASLAGFKYLDGIVGMHYLAMPLENRPNSTWTDDYIYNVGYHLGAPLDLYERIYPFGVANARDFVTDANPVIVVSSGEVGLLAGIAEGVGEVGGDPCRPECILTSADVDALVAKVRDIDQNRDRERISKVTVYLPANVFISENEAILRYFFEQTQILQQQGIITWASQKQVYVSYLEWNK